MTANVTISQQNVASYNKMSRFHNKEEEGGGDRKQDARGRQGSGRWEMCPSSTPRIIFQFQKSSQKSQRYYNIYIPAHDTIQLLMKEKTLNYTVITVIKK